MNLAQMLMMARPLKLSYQQVILADHPVAYWPLNETSGTVANDLSGKGNNLNISGFTLAAAPLVPALGACMIAQSATSQMTAAETLTNIPVGDSNYTLEIWIGGATSYAGYNALLSYGGSTTDETNGFQITNNSGTVLNNWWWGNNATQAYAFQPNTAYHLVATYDGNYRRLYVNGALIATIASSGMAVPSSENFVIGNPSTAFVGAYSNAAIYNTALTAAQIQNHYNAGIA